MSDNGYSRTGEPDVGYWIGQIRKGIEWRKKRAYQGKWDYWQKMYRGEWDAGVMPVNLFFKMVRTMVPRVYFRDPTVSILQTMPGDEMAVFAQILERVDNKLIRRLRLKGQMKLAIQDAFMCGTGILKLGFGAQYTPTPDAFNTEAPDSKKKRGERLEYDSLIEPNMPWVQRVHPRHFVVPDRCTSLDEARWVAHEIMVSLADLKNDPRFKNTLGMETHRPIGSNLMGADANVAADKVVLYEIRDKKFGKVFVIAPNHSQKVLLIDDDKFLAQTGRFSFYPIVFNNSEDAFWGVPDAQILDPQQREANETRTIIMKHRRLSIMKMAVKRNVITPDEIEKMTSSDVGAAFEVDEMGSFEPFNLVAAIPEGLTQSLQMVEQEAQEIMGLGANQFGEYAPGSSDRSATEASIVNQATQIRIDERRDAVADSLCDIVAGMHVVIFQFWTQGQVVDIVGDEGATQWVQFTPEMLQRGTYDINIDPDSGLPETAQIRKQTALTLYPILMANPYVNKFRTTQYLLRELHGAQYDHLLMTPQELQQQAQAQQQAAMSAQQFAENNPHTVARKQGKLSPHMAPSGVQ
jgi:hypothetical protein